MVGNVILILGGTREAIEIAFDLEQIENTTVVTSLAGVTRSPRLPNGKVRMVDLEAKTVFLII